MGAVMAFCGICLLLVAGKVLRVVVPLLQRLYLPASVIGGLLGLVVVSIAGEGVSRDWYAPWGAFPGFLINIVFAALFLGVKHDDGASPGKPWALVAPQVCFGQMLAWGQYVVGLGLCLFLLTPLYGVPAVFGNLIEIGFEGGHGTVGGLGDTFAQLGWAEGKDLGYTVATVGMLLGIVIGMAMVNVAARRGYVGGIRAYSDQSRLEKIGVYPEHAQPGAGKQTVYPDSIDSLALHIALIGVAILIGCFLKAGLSGLDAYAPQALRDTRLLQSFPLFPLCMVGGLLLRAILRRTRTDVVADAGQMQRIAGTALDFLVVSAVASIRLDFVADYWQPLLWLCLAGTAWNVLCVLYVAPRMFREAWFERSIAEFGQSMGVTATGLMLLRTVDPESRTPAAAAFGYKQLFHEPFMGGGFWTSLAVPLAVTWGGGKLLAVCAVALAAWVAVWLAWFRVKPTGRRPRPPAFRR
ncbi:MAG: sodium:glutamate symporter [Acidobacteriota bacterium]|jgi:ESS family glutamate:Na+ symporter|nr:sodium:glutamate symporter [Acidobacteriota bacterium]